jgi:broad specificity phosphatase PhoE
VARLYVARHGETEWNYEGRYQGRRESQLSALGQRQAGALAEALAESGSRRVISSPLSRCVDTAAEVARRLGVDLETDERLLEIAHGTWEGQLRDEIERSDSARMAAWRSAPDTVAFDGGESLADVDARWRAFAASLDGKNDVVVVTHDVLIRLAILAATNRPQAEFWQPRVRNGGYAVFERSGDDWQLAGECCDQHLAGMLADTSRQAL